MQPGFAVITAPPPPPVAGAVVAYELEQAEATSATIEIRAAALRLLNIGPFLLVEWMRIAIRQATVFRSELPDLLPALLPSMSPLVVGGSYTWHSLLEGSRSVAPAQSYAAHRISARANDSLTGRANVCYIRMRGCL